MAVLASLSFMAPLALLALLALPALWWLLRATPPAPARMPFPPINLLRRLARAQETPQKTPWWLLVLRLAMLGALILAFAGPLWRAAAPLELPGQAQTPLLIVLESDWATAHDWPARKAQAERLVETAEQAGRPMAVLALPQPGANTPLPGDAATALAMLETLQPQPVTMDRGSAASLVTGLLQTPAWSTAGAVWMTSGLANASDAQWRAELAVLDHLALVEGTPPDLALTLDGGANGPAALLNLVAAAAGSQQVPTSPLPMDAQLIAYDSAARALAQMPLHDAQGVLQSRIAFDVPLDLRNDIARIAISPLGHIGHVLLIDDRQQRRRVVIVGGERQEQAQPLLSGTTFVERALRPLADVQVPRTGDSNGEIIQALETGADVLILVGNISLIPSTQSALEPWLEAGGVLIRFASLGLSEADDALLPVPLRRVERQLGGALTWEEPQPIAPFGPSSPFAGLTIADDVRIERQILSEPGAARADAVFAELADATPLVTGQQRGNGTIILFHVAADTSWSNLPISGLFVDMLARLVELSVPGSTRQSAQSPALQRPDALGAREEATLPALRTLSAFGVLVAPASHVESLRLVGGQAGAPTLNVPPGLYGPADSPLALNLFASSPVLVATSASNLQADNAQRLEVAIDEVLALRLALLGLVILLAFADAVLVLLLSGTLVARRPMPRAAALALLGSVLGAALGLTLQPAGSMAQSSARPEAGAQSDIARLIAAASTTRLAYVITGDGELDRRSREGLDGLTRILTQRTAFEPGAPFGVDVRSDELAFYPLLYWPMPSAPVDVSDTLIARIDAYMNNGGTILFDTRDEAASLASASLSPQTANLRAILGALDVPPLEPVPADHVMTKSFYLIDSFPGRYASGPLWVEALPENIDPGQRPARGGDGVSPLMITGNDLASAWALSPDGRPLYATSPPDPLQREFAYRTGVNIAMYVMTGNYKADQVHIPALLERLGQ